MKTRYLFVVICFLLISLCFIGCKQDGINEIIIPEDIPEVLVPPNIDYFNCIECYYEVTMSEDMPKVACLMEVIFGEKADITGKWQLLSANGGFKGLWPNETFDFTCDTIIYEFFEEGTFKDSSKIAKYPQIELFNFKHTFGTLRVTSNVERFYEGVYTYDFRGNLIGHPLMVDGGNLLIDDIPVIGCTVMQSIMSITTSTDGMIFARIE